MPTACTQLRSVVHRLSSKPTRHVHTRARVSAMESPTSPNKHNASPIADAE